MNFDTAKRIVGEYEGKNLYSIGTHISEKSSYNYNFYSLPNGSVVLMVNDDEGWNDVFAIGEDGERFLVGGQYDDKGFMLGSFT